MKILVDELPTSSEECPFSRKEIAHNLVDINTGDLAYLYEFYCNIDLKRCMLECNGECDKLKKYKGEIFAEWVIPVTQEPWKKGYFGLCTNCKGINDHTNIAPLFCDKCGATMLNSTYKKYPSR